MNQYDSHKARVHTITNVYLQHLFTELPKAETVEEIEALLPGNLSTDQIRTG